MDPTFAYAAKLFIWLCLFAGSLVWFVYCLLYSKEPRPSKRRPFRPTLSPRELARIKGDEGEHQVLEILKNGLPPDYIILPNVMLPDRGRTTQIDLIVLHASGIFVIEVKSYSARIVGNSSDPEWAALYDTAYPFTNPLHQNAAHMGVLSDCFHLSVFDFMSSIVVFLPSAKLDDYRPSNVLFSHELLSYILSRSSRRVLVAEALPTLARAILDVDAAISPEIRAMHGVVGRAEPVKPRCPKCGAIMIPKRRNDDNAPFWGCPHWPRCDGGRIFFKV